MLGGVLILVIWDTSDRLFSCGVPQHGVRWKQEARQRGDETTRLILDVVISLLGKSWPLPANARLLERPQGVQRCLLCVGETPDACDIKPFVGTISSQRAQVLATFEVPERDGPVIAATGELAAIGAHLEGL